MSGIHPITAEQGATFKLNFTVTIDGVAWDLTGYKARMQVRADYNTSTKILDLSTDNGSMTVNSLGKVSATANASVMSSAPAGRWVYDVELESAGGEVTRILEGKFIITAQVTA